MTDRLHDLQRHGLFSQQPQGPVGKSFRRLAQPQRDDLRFLLSVENLPANPTLGFAGERYLKPLGHQTLPEAFHGLPTTVECLGDFCVGPMETIHVRLEQDLRTTHLLRRDTPHLQELIQCLSLCIRQPNKILLLHRPTLLGWAHND